MRPGVTCERCHGPGRTHAEAARAGRPNGEVARVILNPGRFPAKAQVEMCGECHRLPEPGEVSPAPEMLDPIAVRFQPIGLMASRCFLVSRNLSCLTCHDPHEDARPRARDFYAARCLACHKTAASVCSCRATRTGLPPLPHAADSSAVSQLYGSRIRFTDFIRATPRKNDREGGEHTHSSNPKG
jgi:hypothetical protein